MTDSPDSPNFLRGAEAVGHEADLLAEPPLRLTVAGGPGVGPSEAEQFWHRLDQQFNIPTSKAWERGERARLLCKFCQEPIGVVLDLGDAVVLGLLVDEVHYGDFVLLAAGAVSDGATDAGVMREACGPVPPSATCPRHGDRPLEGALRRFRSLYMQPGTKPMQKISPKV